MFGQWWMEWSYGSNKQAQQINRQSFTMGGSMIILLQLWFVFITKGTTWQHSLWAWWDTWQIRTGVQRYWWDLYCWFCFPHKKCTLPPQVVAANFDWRGGNWGRNPGKYLCKMCSNINVSSSWVGNEGLAEFISMLSRSASLWREGRMKDNNENGNIALWLLSSLGGDQSNKECLHA